MKKSELWLAAAALLTLAAGLGLRDPWAPDEPRYALIAAEMLKSGDWSVTRLGGVIYAEKPPVYFWLLAAAEWLGGLRSGFLLPSLAAGVGSLALTWDLARRLWSRETAWWATAALLACLQFTLQARSAQIDAVLCFLTTLSLYGLLRHLLLGPNWACYTLSFFAAGVGVMTKGVGFLPLLALMPWGLTRAARWPLPALGGGARWLLGPLAFLTPLAAWLTPLLMRAANNPELTDYLDNLLFRQTITRYADPWHHFQPFWYFFVEVMPWAWFPLILLFPWLGARWFRRIASRDPRVALLLGWIVLVVLFFSISPAKRDVYLLPTVPALALLAAPHLKELAARIACLRVLRWAAFLLMFAIAGASAWLLWGDTERLAELTTTHETSATPLWTLFCGALAGSFFALLLPTRRALGGLALLLFLGWQLWGWILQPQIDDARSGRRIAERTLAAIPAGAPLALADWRPQQVLHLNRAVIHFRSRNTTPLDEIEQAAAWLAGKSARWLLTPAEHRDLCFKPDSGLMLGHAHRRDWLLVTRQDLSGVCAGSTDTARAVHLPPLRP